MYHERRKDSPSKPFRHWADIDVLKVNLRDIFEFLYGV